MTSQSLFAGVLRLGGATLIGQAVALAAWPFLTRLYAPADIGVFVIYLALANIIGACACLRYELAIVLPRTLRGAASLVQVAFVASLAIAGILALLVLAAGDQIAASLGLGSSSSVLWVVPVVVGARGIYQALNYWASRRRHTGVIAFARIGQQTIAVCVQIGAAFTVLTGGIALALGHLAGIAAAGLVFLAVEGGALVRTYRVQAGRNFRRASAMAVRHQRFPRYDVPAALLNVAALELPVIFIGVFYSEALTGQFGLAVRVTGRCANTRLDARRGVFVASKAAWVGPVVGRRGVGAPLVKRRLVSRLRCRRSGPWRVARSRCLSITVNGDIDPHQFACLVAPRRP